MRPCTLRLQIAPRRRQRKLSLVRARLFGLSKDRPTSYPWNTPPKDLAEARRLIEKHGYWRRKEEFEDADAAVRQ
jgi:hypothetical protein